VLLLDYPLAPEARFPAALDATVDALTLLMNKEFAQLAIGGDSAGANLAVAATQASHSKPDACIVLSPYLDLTHAGESVTTRGPRDPFVDTSTMRDTAATYLGNADPADRRASPLFGSVDHFPPTLIQVGSEEALFSDADRFAVRLREADIPVTFQEWAGMIHVWPIFAGQIDEGAWAIAQMGSFLCNLR
jgi:acetyl esterase/lipase